jgi:hypothetical protein
VRILKGWLCSLTWRPAFHSSPDFRSASKRPKLTREEGIVGVFMYAVLLEFRILPSIIHLHVSPDQLILQVIEKARLMRSPCGQAKWMAQPMRSSPLRRLRRFLPCTFFGAIQSSRLWLMTPVMAETPEKGREQG